MGLWTSFIEKMNLLDNAKIIFNSIYLRNWG